MGCIKTKKDTFTHNDVEDFVEALRCLISPEAVAPFGNPSGNITGST
jgi:hypothetical protein